MKLLTIRPLKGLDLPGNVENGSAVNGLKLVMTTEAEAVYARGWQLHLRGPLLMFESPPAKSGMRRLYVKQWADFDLGFELGPDETIENLNRWDSHPAAEQKGAKK